MEPTVDRPAPQVTVADIRTLVDSSAELPVLYINYGPGDDGDTEAELDVWATGLVFQPDIVLTHATALDQLGEEPSSETIAEFLPRVQKPWTR
ncbi:hypothetical protein [Streptomyces sp. R08]|uniref:Uncharacterized protein n=1 Tax=Streptomyces sp. R08 TaxID=3238624 RepID=A0AB39MR67_9ACTN